MQPMPSAEKHTTSAKRGKHTTSAKRKTCRCQAQEKKQPVPSAGKHAIGTKRGNTHGNRRERDTTFGFALIIQKTALKIFHFFACNVLLYFYVDCWRHCYLQ